MKSILPLPAKTPATLPPRGTTRPSNREAPAADPAPAALAEILDACSVEVLETVLSILRSQVGTVPAPGPGTGETPTASSPG